MNGATDVTTVGDLGVLVRPERSDEAPAIRAVVDEAFGADRSVGPLVDKIRASTNYVPDFSLVAVAGDEIVGHVMLSRCDLVEQDGSRVEVLTLSPLSVAVAHQGRGIGGLLVTTALAAAEEAHEQLVVLEGSPRYYPRFGFEPAGTFGVTITLPSWAPPEAAMAYALSSYTSDVRGHVTYPPAFEDVIEH